MATETKYRADHAGDWGIADESGSGGYQTETLALRDGTKLFFRSWQASDPQAPVLVLLHGLGAHTGWFIDMGNELRARGVTVYADDHRGFGRSGGARGHVRDWHTYVSDVSEFFAAVRERQPNAPISLLGHSMGAVFALYFAADDARSGRNQLASLLLLNPWIADTTRVKLGTMLALLFGGLRGSDKTYAVAGGPEAMTTNPEATTMLNADPHWVRAESAAFLFQIGLKMRGGAIRQARDVRAPTLVLQAEADRAVQTAATRRCYEALGSKEKQLLPLPGYAHDSELEANRSALDDQIARWLLSHRS
jgi:alpha-beta hydrolase superfamily lysophospholipase